MSRSLTTTGGLALVLMLSTPMAAAQDQLVTVALTYHQPADKSPRPNFSPKGTQVTLADVPASMPLPSGAVRPAKRGLLQVGPDRASWLPVLATASQAHPSDLARIFIDHNRNGSFTDDGPGVSAAPSQNEKTKAWWSSFNAVALTVRYPSPDRTAPYLVNFWIVREDGAKAPDILRYSRSSWRSGETTINGIRALVAMMDGNNDAIYGRGDSWSVVQASMADAPTAVLSIKEARETSRFMFLERPGGRDVVLEFRDAARDGSSITFAVVDRPVSKAEDRLPDDMLVSERPRPRAPAPLTWSHSLDDALAEARRTGKRLLIDFETTWCGPCKTMDEWIWTDAQVVATIRAGFVGVKLDGDVEKAAVSRFSVKGYPTMVIVDPASGRAVRSVTGYQSSTQMLAFLQ